LHRHLERVHVDQRVSEYNDCVFSCANDPNCCASCAANNETGAVIFTELVFCLTCQACPFECSLFVPGFCN